MKGCKDIEEYQQFIEGKKVIINLLGIIYVPDACIVLIIKTKDNIKINNQYSHITGFIKTFAPKDSNTVLEAVMKNQDIKNLYNKMISSEECKFNEKDCLLYSEKIQVNRHSYTAYVKFVERQIELESNGARIVGVVLNGIKRNQVDYDSYSYYGYY